MKVFFRFGAVAAAGVLLAGCSAHFAEKSPALASHQTSGSSNSSAQAYGAGSASGYQTMASRSSTSRNGIPANSLSAPSNQTYYFDFDSNDVHSSDVRAIDAQANYLASHPNAKVRLEGNTDNRGSREYNVGLGWRRDQSVEHYLTERGVSPKQIQMVSYGKEHPAAAGNTSQAWALNRRVNLIYKAKS